ncbi:MAG TPA: hypothetical protein PK969_05930, partial [Treponemataceae bacterium]|nr:hypothetical protein [Treponemataceae bacterium]
MIHSDTVFESSGTGAAGNITFAKTVNDSSAGTHDITVNTSGTSMFSGAVGSTTAFASIATDAGSAGSTAVNGGAIATTGMQTFNDPVSFGSDASLTASVVIFNASAEGNGNSLDIFGNAQMGNSASDTASGFSALSISGTTGMYMSAVSSAGTQIYGDAAGTDTITLHSNAELTASTVTFNAPIAAAAHTLEISGNAVFGNEGSDTATGLWSLSVSGTTSINTTAITSTGTQSYGDAAGTDTITLGADTTLTGSTITFNAPLAGAAHTLAITGNAVFGDSTGDDTAAGLATLAVSGTANINTSAVSSTGTQTYGDTTGSDTITLGANTTLTGSTVTFNAPVAAAAHSLAIAGNAVFGDSNGDDTATGLATLWVSGTTNINTTAISATGAHTYGDTTGTDTITLGANTTLTGSTVTFNAPLAGAAHTLAITGNAVFGNEDSDTATDLASLAVSGTTGINTTAVSATGTQAYGDATGTDTITLGANTTLTGSTITFNAPVAAAAHSLAVNGNAVFGDSTGDDTATGLATLAVSGTTNINTTAVSATGTQTYGDATGTDTITLGVNTTLTGSTVTFNAPIAAAAHALGITGNAVFGNEESDTATGFSTLAVSGTTNINTTAISATGTHAYGDTAGTDTITLGANTTLTGSTVTFNAPLIAAAHTLDIAGNAVFGDSTGDDTATGLATLAVSGTANINTTAVTSTGTQVYGDTAGTDTITLGANTTLTGSTVTFNAPIVAAAHTLAVDGNAVFGDSTGDDTATGLATLAVSGSAKINTTAVTSTGTQTFGDAAGTDTITLGANTTLTGSTVTFNAPIAAAAHSLAVTGNAVFGDSTGDDTATGLATLAVSGTTNINTTAVMSTGTQSYGDAAGIDTITLGANTTLTGSTVTFNAPIAAAAHTLAITGNAVFGDSTGDDTATGLASLSVSGSASINTTAITSTGTQLWSGPLSIERSTTLTAGGITAESTVNGQNNLTLNASGPAAFEGEIGLIAAESPNGLGSGTGASIVMLSTGTTVFEKEMRTASGIAQADATGLVTFNGSVSVSSASAPTEFLSDAAFDFSAQEAFSSAGAIVFGTATAVDADRDTVTISGNAASGITIRTLDPANGTITINSTIASSIPVAVENSGILKTNENADISISVPTAGTAGFVQRSPSAPLSPITDNRVQLAGGIETSGSRIEFESDVFLFGTAGSMNLGASLNSGSADQQSVLFAGSAHIAAPGKTVRPLSPWRAEGSIVLYGGTLDFYDGTIRQGLT